jgi:hypothetical protein
MTEQQPAVDRAEVSGHLTTPIEDRGHGIARRHLPAAPYPLEDVHAMDHAVGQRALLHHHTDQHPAPVDLDAVLRLCDAATPGPLEAIALGSEGYAIRPRTGDMRQRARVAMCGYRAWEEDRANAEFFAAARTLLPQMADELEAERKENDYLRRQCGRLSEIGNEQAVLAWKEVQRVLREREGA